MSTPETAPVTPHSAPGSRCALPPNLEARPKDRRGYPITFVTTMRDGEADFAAIDQAKVLTALLEKLCGLCGRPLTDRLAFLGGPGSAEQGTYLDPPMHVECAEAAVYWCPHIALRRPQRSKQVHDDTVTPEGFEENKPDEWVMYITRACQVTRLNGALVILAAPAERKRHFRYHVSGRIVEDVGYQDPI